METVFLGAIAGFTIYLGLPFARLQSLRRGLQGFLSALATGILVFLLWDVISKANEPITSGPSRIYPRNGVASLGAQRLG